MDQKSTSPRTSPPTLSQALPAPEEERDQRAWIKGITICTWILASVFIINIILTIIASVIAYTNTPTPSRISYAALYTGSCATTKSWTTGLHLLINVLSTILLAAGNYCMQCLASPSRGQVDAAHSKREWVRTGGRISGGCFGVLLPTTRDKKRPDGCWAGFFWPRRCRSI